MLKKLIFLLIGGVLIAPALHAQQLLIDSTDISLLSKLNDSSSYYNSLIIKLEDNMEFSTMRVPFDQYFYLKFKLEPNKKVLKYYLVENNKTPKLLKDKIEKKVNNCIKKELKKQEKLNEDKKKDPEDLKKKCKEKHRKKSLDKYNLPITGIKQILRDDKNFCYLLIPPIKHDKNFDVVISIVKKIKTTINDTLVDSYTLMQNDTIIIRGSEFIENQTKIINDTLIKKKTKYLNPTTSKNEVAPTSRFYLSTIPKTLKERIASRINPEFGLIYVPFWGGKNKLIYENSVNLVFNISYNLKPINESIKYGKSYRFYDPSRFSAIFGITLNSISKEGIRKDLLGSSSLIIGGGYKFNDVIKGTMGALIFNEVVPKPFLKEDTRVRAAFFAGVTIDFDLKDLFGGIISKIGFK